jgi:two-component system, sensor histidine kinase
MTTSIQQRIRAEQIKAQYASMPASFLGSVFSSGTYLLAAHAVLPLWQSLLWGGLMVAQAIGRALLWQAYRRCQPSPMDTERWARYAILGSAVSGCIWGLGTFLVFPGGHIEYQLFFMFLIASMGSLSAIASASYLPAFYAYTFPTILPIAITLVLAESGMLRVLGIISLGYLPVISTFAHNLGRSVIDSFRLRFENLDLLREVVERKEQVEEASREKSMFLATASHDLRQPLHALALQTHLLQRTALSPSQQQHVAGMRSSIQSMTGLFDALLDMSRLDAGVIPVCETSLSLSELFQQIEREFQPSAAGKGLRLKVRPTKAVVRSDGSLLASMLGNLVSNAIRYTHSGGVLLAARRRGSEVSIEVWDTGVGIAPKDQRAIFKAFYQVGNVERDRSKGLGLGLAIVERLSRLLHAPLELRSRPAHGSLFRVRVPSATESRTSDQQEPAASVPLLEDLSKTSVMVVDNEAEIRAAMTALIESWGCRVVSAGSASEAMSRAGAMDKRPDLIVSDYRLGAGETGLQLIEMLRDEFNHAVPALVVTGDTGAEVLREVEGADCTLLHKPVQPEAMQLLMRQLLSRRPD